MAVTTSREQFVQLALEQLDVLDRYARHLTRDDALADDLIQDTYLQAIRARDTFELRAHGIRAWLLRILHNVFLNRIKREARQPVAMEVEWLDESVSIQPDELERTLLDDGPEFDGKLGKALDDLPADLRTILILWGVDELSYKELAHVLDLPMGTVMSRLYRARQKVIQHVRSAGEPEQGARRE